MLRTVKNEEFSLQKELVVALENVTKILRKERKEIQEWSNSIKDYSFLDEIPNEMLFPLDASKFINASPVYLRLPRKPMKKGSSKKGGLVSKTDGSLKYRQDILSKFITGLNTAGFLAAIKDPYQRNTI